MDESESAQALPCFQLEAQPSEVPAELLALPSDARVDYIDFTGTIGYEALNARFRLSGGGGRCSAGSLVVMIQERIERQKRGFYTPAEAAVILAENFPGTLPGKQLEDFEDAYLERSLVLRRRSDRRPRRPVPGERWGGEHIHCEYLHREELNDWFSRDGTTQHALPDTPAKAETQSTSRDEMPPRRSARKGWRDVAWTYMVERLRAGQFPTAAALNHALFQEAGNPDSPFEQGEGVNRGKLWVREVGKPLAKKTIQNHWGELKEDAMKR